MSEYHHPVAGVLHTPAPTHRTVILEGAHGHTTLEGVLPPSVPPRVHVVDMRVLDLKRIQLTLHEASDDFVDVVVLFPTPDALIDAVETIHAVVHGR